MSAYHPNSAEPPLHLPYPGAPFSAAFLRFWKKGLTFTGRASRAEYWKAYAVTVGGFVALYLLSTIITAVAMSSYSSGMLGFAGVLMVLAFVYGVAAAVPSIAACVRRLHDTNQPGVMYFVGLIPFVGGFILLYFLAQESRAEGAKYDLPAPYGAPTAYAPPAPPVAPVLAAPTSYAPVPPPPVPVAPASYAPVPPPAPVAPAQALFAPPPPPPVPVYADPTDATVLAVPRPVSAAGAAPDLDLDLDETRISPAVSAWVLELPDGRRVAASSTVFVGRAPAASDDARGALLVPIDDPAKSMSKTHARIDIADGTLLVTDLHSTNGTVIRDATGQRISLVGGAAQRVTEDVEVQFGDYVVAIRRGAR